MKWSKYVKPYWKYFVLGPLCMIVEVLGEIVMPKLYSQILNVGVETHNVGYIVVTALLMILTALLMMGGGVGGAYFGARASVNFASDLRQDVYAKVQQFSFANIDRYSTGSLVTRLTNDITQLQNFVNMMLRMFLRAPGMLIGALIMAIMMNPELARVLAVTIPVLLLTQFFIIRYGFPRFTVMQEKIDKLNSTIQESLTNIRVVKSFVREDYEDAKFRKSNSDLKDAALRALGVVIFMMPVMMLLMNFTSMAVVWFGGKQVIAGDMPVGDFSAFLTYITQILMSLMMLGMLFMNSSRALASSRRVKEVMLEKIDLSDENAAHPDAKVTRGDIEFRHVTFRYYKNSENGVLNDVNLRINAGETVGIIGSTGCGKTTLVSMIPRLYDVDEGQVLVDGVFGTGFHGELDKDTMGIFGIGSGAYRIAVDIPSGGNSSEGTVSAGIFKADETLTFGYLKTGMSQFPLKKYCGRITVADIGIPKGALKQLFDGGEREYHRIERNFLAAYPPKRERDSHKGDFGTVLVIAGSSSMRGAAAFATLGALRPRWKSA